MVEASVSDIWKWASEFRVEPILNLVDAEKRISVGKAAGPAVIHGQDIDLDRVYSHSGKSECVLLHVSIWVHICHPYPDK